ncbi:hypothetical protein [Streptomyces sp. NPDC020681]|uniref:hypothetical protein n=1 Tax=Streptomyces sp. NPDC020681 TaxID=3365083 RepID=UPI00379405A5
MNRPREIGYTDGLLADGSVHRAYEDGRQEWRRRGTRHVVHWHDSQGGSGTDELLGMKILKRVLADGTVIYGRDIGYGRTVWGRGETVMINRTSFGGRMGAILVGLGVTGLAVTAAQLPPLYLSPEQEEALRQQQAAQSSSSGSDGGSDGGGGDSGDPSGDQGGDDSWDSSWDGDDGGWTDDDFG